MEVKVFKSEFTGELFEDEDKYQKHLQSHAQKQAEEERQKELNSKRVEIINNARLTATSIEDFRQKAFYAITQLSYGCKVKLRAMLFSGLRFGDVSNSHSAPIGKKTNWSQRDAKLPTSYKGWYGDVTFVYSTDTSRESRIEDIVENFPALNTGSGGFIGDLYDGKRAYILRYELRLYIDDFPLIKAQYDRYQELCVAKQSWAADIVRLTDEMNSSDEILDSYKRFAESYKQKVRDMESLLSEYNVKVSNRSYKNSESVFIDNQFLFSDELTSIKNALFIR